MLSRRELIGKAAVGAAAALTVGGVVGTAVAATRPLRSAADDPTNDRDGQSAATDEQDRDGGTSLSDAVMPPPWNLVRPLVAGSALAQGWQLVDLGPVRSGSCVATLRNERGRSRRIHLCRNDGTPQGLGHTRRVDLVVMNEGQGELPTEEHLAQAVAALARAIAANETQAPGDLFAALLPHAERVRRFAVAGDITTEGKLR